ncbi:lytic transglycosylase domain-containing protein [Rhizobium sp. SSA_523]|uniref:lytic transglycosylase domain-containing protein n=1 Tax=Rhizobium sp. SSA_523 TaxID=2952477 RepID=UPI00209050D3|nr:lytic transglycosylase domain-containing protein [Rhizobium sp. SSA_523]MCO5730842.1 lytic transglycosylase domain-containing protein [Rhizobium sp. SSA_523]WKC24337.1 lytic transglycosylase domain-containing protein [Rhizobium sp. SSA_523]
MTKTLLTAVLASAFCLSGALASSLPERAIPLPFARPDNPAARAFPPSMITGAIPRPALPDAPQSLLKTGLDALSERNAAAALAARDGLAPGSLDRHLLTWAIVTSGLGAVPSYEIAAAQGELKGWPGLSQLRATSERALWRENPTPQQVLTAFGATRPETVQGAMILARALLASNQEGKAASKAADALRPFWIGYPLDKGTEDRILSEFGPLLRAADHKARMDYLMYRGRVSQAKRFATLGNAQSLYAAWSAVASKAKNAGALLDAVDRSLTQDPAYLFVRIEYLRHQDQYEAAARLLERSPRDAADKINTTEWWNERRIVARGLADQGDFRQAYKIAAAHSARQATDIVDAEFHAGWYALRGLNDANSAAAHFERILKTSSRPLSASRALYWLGRAAEAGGPGTAQDYYEKASRYTATFYGQLAAAKLKKRQINLAYPAPAEADRHSFEAREPVRAIKRLEEVGHGDRAEALYRALGEELANPAELAILAARAETYHSHALSLSIGKSAFNRGIDVAALAFPIGVIPANADIAGSGKALAYAIARQESAFNPAAVSPANARGLLQLLPGTAKGVAGRHGMTFTPARLTSDAGYNATLGAHYLGEQIDAFGGSYILTFIAYNAGPRRVPEWIERYGDPRGQSIDAVIDWIERIPFPETRNYVQRVMENYQVYKMRLGQEADIEDDLRFGRR